MAHTHEVVYSLVHWLDDEVFEQYPTWEDCLRAGIFSRPELEKFFGEVKEGENGNLIGGPGNYEQCVERGVGRRVVTKMLKGTENVEAIKQVTHVHGTDDCVRSEIFSTPQPGLLTPTGPPACGREFLLARNQPPHAHGTAPSP